MKFKGVEYEEEIECHQAFGKKVFTCKVWHPSASRVPLTGNGPTEAKARSAALKALTAFDKGLAA